MKETIGLGLIGAGRAGMIHARNFSRRVPNAKMIACSDVAEESARGAAIELGITAWHTDWHEILTNSAIDAVLVVTPTKFHHEIVIEAAKAKKHIFCEKPMAMNKKECQQMKTLWTLEYSF